MVVGDVLDDGRRLVTLLADDLLDAYGEVPLPPYIHVTLADASRYQTVYANEPGSVAAPTAASTSPRTPRRPRCHGRRSNGSSFGWSWHVSSDLHRHRGRAHHAHRALRDPTRRLGAHPTGERAPSNERIALRTLESAHFQRLAGETDLFITRGYEFGVVDRLLTNFHVPRSSLLVLVDAFVGSDRWKALYAEALANDYRFLSLATPCC
ncbi:MAG: S-adenosylmethionine:tRNA ribosyltransferase-isomerase [Acidimicrobiales bacterium]